MGDGKKGIFYIYSRYTVVVLDGILKRAAGATFVVAKV